MKAIHNALAMVLVQENVVLYPKDTEKWKQFTTLRYRDIVLYWLFCIPKILKNESNSQQYPETKQNQHCCFVSQRYWKMKAIHNEASVFAFKQVVVLYPKDTEKWKQFTTTLGVSNATMKLFCIPKILKNESNSQLRKLLIVYYKVVLYPKDTEKWKQFTTIS